MSTELSKDKASSRMEIIIPITPRDLWKGLTKIFVDAPNNGLAWIGEKSEKFSRWLMSGRASIISMPAGIMLRNGARATMNMTDTSGDMSIWAGGARLIGGLSAAAALWFGGTFIGGALAATGVGATITGAVGAWGTLATGLVIAAPIVLPAFGVTTAAAVIASAALITGLSVVPAVANLHVAFKRTIDAWKGIKYDDTILQPEKSLSDKLKERRQRSTATDALNLPVEMQTELGVNLMQRYDRDGKRAVQIVGQLDDSVKKAVFASLSTEFAAASTPAADTTTSAPTAKTAPKGKTQSL